MINNAKGMTVEEFKQLDLCWKDDADKMQFLDELGTQHGVWTALDVLNIPISQVSDEDKLWAVLRMEFIDIPLLYEFADLCNAECVKFKLMAREHHIILPVPVSSEYSKSDGLRARRLAWGAAYDLTWDYIKYGAANLKNSTASREARHLQVEMLRQILVNN